MLEKQNTQFGINGLNGINTCMSGKYEIMFKKIRPLSLQKNMLMKFPLDALPEKMNHYVQCVAECSQTDMIMPAVMAIGTIAAVAQGKYDVVDHGGHHDPVNVYTSIVAGPGERKSGTIDLVAGVLYYYDSSMKAKHFVFDDCTSEALVEQMANNGGKGVVISSEGGIFDILAGRYSKIPNLDIWLKAHTCDFLKIDRKGEAPIVICNPILSTVLTVQPEVLEEIMANKTMTGRGLIARFLFAFPESMNGRHRYLHPNIPDDVKQEYEKLLLYILEKDTSQGRISLRFSDECLETLEQYYDEVEAFILEQGAFYQEWLAKYFGTMKRIAGLLHIAGECEGEVISLDTLKNAIRISEFFKNHAEYAFSLMGEDKLIVAAKTVVRKLQENPESLCGVKRHQLFRSCRGRYFHNVEEIEPVLDLLEEYGWICVIQEERMGAGRKPDSKVFLNPEVIGVKT